MSTIDLVFEGGGAKGMVFTGALEVLFGAGHAHGRLLGTSAGAITAVSLAAGYSPAEMQAALIEQDPATKKPLLAGFLGLPAPFDDAAVRDSDIRKLLAGLDIPFVPDATEGRIDEWIASRMASNEHTRHLFAFIARGGWYSADPFVAWMQRRLSTGEFNGRPRDFAAMTLAQFHETTGADVTLVAADTTDARMLLLNHRTAPQCPVVWAARMSMSVPLLWEEVKWQADWGDYWAWDPKTQQLQRQEIGDHTIVDGGLVSNFPIALFLASRDDVAAVVGPARTKNVLGLLIDETLPVTGHPKPKAGGDEADKLGQLQTAQRLAGLVNTATGSHDNLAKTAFARNVVRLPAKGYGTTDFDMPDEDREALVEAGRQAMEGFLAQQSVLESVDADTVFAAKPGTLSLANEAAAAILLR
jgi:predicted acylesterase/phospholipase RssA